MQRRSSQCYANCLLLALALFSPPTLVEWGQAYSQRQESYCTVIDLVAGELRLTATSARLWFEEKWNCRVAELGTFVIVIVIVIGRASESEANSAIGDCVWQTSILPARLILTVCTAVCAHKGIDHRLMRNYPHCVNALQTIALLELRAAFNAQSMFAIVRV